MSSLLTCPHCKKVYASNFSTCPHCSSGVGGCLAGIVVLLAIVLGVAAFALWPKSADAPEPNPAPVAVHQTPEEIAAARAEEVARQRDDNTRKSNLLKAGRKQIERTIDACRSAIDQKMQRDGGKYVVDEYSGDGDQMAAQFAGASTGSSAERAADFLKIRKSALTSPEPNLRYAGMFLELDGVFSSTSSRVPHTYFCTLKPDLTIDEVLGGDRSTCADLYPTLCKVHS